MTELFQALPFTNIFKTFRFAIQPGKLIIALMAIAVLYIAGMLMDLYPTVVVSPGAVYEDIATAPGTGVFWINPPSELHASLSGHDTWSEYVTAYSRINEPIGVFAALRCFCAARFHGFATALARADMTDAVANLRMLAAAIWWAARYHTLYFAVFSVIALVVLSLAGGAICRSAALQFARDERPGLVESLRFSVRRFPTLLSAPLWPIGIVALIVVLLAVLGLPGNIGLGIGPVFIGIISPLAMLMGFIAAIFVIGSIAGGSLMYPAAAYESSDGMDAMGRAFGYVYMRPWRMACYTALSIVYGAVCYLFVRLFGFLLLLIAKTSLGAMVFVNSHSASQSKANQIALMDAIWPEPTYDTLLGPLPESLSITERIGAVLIRVPNLIVVGLLAAFILSFFFCAATIIYAILRKFVDGEQYDCIALDNSDNSTDNSGT